MCSLGVATHTGRTDSHRHGSAATVCRLDLDGVAGLPEHAPYDRVIATCAVSRVPWSWAEQTTEGGLILADLKVDACVGNLVLLRRQHDRLEGRFDAGYATFMHMRTPAFHVEPQAGSARHRDDARQRTTTLADERIWENLPLWFLVHLQQRGRVGFGYAMDPETGGPGAVFFTSQDGSWCELSTAAADGTRQVWESGPGQLWADIETAMDCWHQQGEPGWDRFGLTVTPHQHTVWLDTPESGHHWPVR
ncbi:MAG: hypothetical protein ACRDTF_05450 [Pseudonocardiaceae bacterium]